MKNFLIVLMFGMFTCVMANARDVGTQLQTDVGTTVLTMQQPIFTADLLTAATFELAPAVQYSCTLPAETKISISPCRTEAIVWIDPGICKQVSVTTNKIYNQSVDNVPKYGFTHTYLPTTRHVLLV